MHEFAVIEHFFASQTVHRSDVALGIGDDCAIVAVPTDQQLVITTDTLINGVHFPVNTSAEDIGYKSLAVNLSDLAAMGATPAWITLALTLPHIDENWLSKFRHGFFELASHYNIQLIGGDLTQGPLAITVQAQGFVPENRAITRSGAKTGDLIYVTNTLGDAGLALLFINKKTDVSLTHQHSILEKFNRPTPRIEIGETLRDFATAAIDISDGLAADLTHILKRSGVGATLNVDKLPISAAVKNSVSREKAISLALNAGDDYELCFTIPNHKERAMLDAFKKYSNATCTCIGMITDTTTLDLLFNDGKKYNGSSQGYQHF